MILIYLVHVYAQGWGTFVCYIMLTFNNVGGKKFKDYKFDIEQNHISLSKLCTGQ